MLSASFSFQEDKSEHYTIKHISIGSYSRGCTVTICSCYGNPFSLPVSGEPLPHRSRVPCRAQKRALIYFTTSRVRWGMRRCAAQSQSGCESFIEHLITIFIHEKLVLHLCPVFTQHACPLMLFLKFSLVY